MKSIAKILLMIIGGIVLTIVGFGFYFASQISAAYPPLKEYNYPLTALKLQDIISEVDKADTNLNCIITDTVGPKDDLAYHMDIKMKKEGVNYSFHIKYEDDKKFWSNAVNSEIGLIEAFDSTHKVGGYQLKNNGVGNLVDLFEKEFTSKLETRLLNDNGRNN
jgi:hypothetical protein